MILNVGNQVQEWLTVQQFIEAAPEKLELNPAKVLRWCRLQRIDSKDVRSKGAERPEWRISVKGAEKAIKNLLAGLPVDA